MRNSRAFIWVYCKKNTSFYFFFQMHKWLTMTPAMPVWWNRIWQYKWKIARGFQRACAIQNMTKNFNGILTERFRFVSHWNIKTAYTNRTINATQSYRCQFEEYLSILSFPNYFVLVKQALVAFFTLLSAKFAPELIPFRTQKIGPTYLRERMFSTLKYEGAFVFPSY